MELASDVEHVFEPLRNRLTLRCRITLLDRPSSEAALREMSFDFGRGFPGDAGLIVIGCKTFIDGTMGSRTARMLRDYSDDPGNRGMLVELAAAGALNAWIEVVTSMGLSPSMHAIGDEAVRMALDALDSLPARMRDGSRPRIEHAQQVDAADIPRFRGVIASMQPLHKADDGRYLPQRIGLDRVKGSFPFRSLADAGALLAFGSDWPVVSCDPILGMRAAITGLTLDDQSFAPEQNLTVEESLRAYTRNAAYCLGMPAGVLTEGLHGDCVMFDIDPFTADWVHRPPRVCMTIVGGKVVFDATGD
jgi:predicted amidohydrolase YtcJ